MIDSTKRVFEEEILGLKIGHKENVLEDESEGDGGCWAKILFFFH